jgi:integrase
MRPHALGAHYRWIDGWWQLPGHPTKVWPGVKNGRDHRIWLAPQVVALLPKRQKSGFVFRTPNEMRLERAIRGINDRIKIRDRLRPHDLRRSFGSTVTRLGHGRDCMNRLLNHIEGGISDVYDAHRYGAESKKVVESVAQFLTDLALGRKPENNVVPIKASA